MNTRDVIVDAGLKSFLERGYEGTGLGPLLASVAVPKGSFYHFFASKEEFAGAVLDAYSARYRSMRAAIFDDRTRSPLERLRTYFENLEREMTADDPARGCLYGVLAQSLPTLNGVLAQRVRAAFTQWESELAELLAEAQRSGEMDEKLDPSEAAAFLIDLYEGAALRARTGDGVASLKSLHRFALRVLSRSR